MKKKYSILMLLMMTLISVSLVSCGDESSSSSDDDDDNTSGSSYGIACDNVEDQGYCTEDTFDPSSLEACVSGTEADSCSTTDLIGTCSSVTTNATDGTTTVEITRKAYYYNTHETVTTCSLLELACIDSTIEAGDITITITEATAECAE